ncbi:MAG: hypothetical protein R3C71_11310 [Candidatus Krumholzibacteriia bacterium]
MGYQIEEIIDLHENMSKDEIRRRRGDAGAVGIPDAEKHEGLPSTSSPKYAPARDDRHGLGLQPALLIATSPPPRLT